MKNIVIKLTSIFLICMMIVGAFASCADTENEGEQTTASAAVIEDDPDTAEATEAETTPVFAEANYGGESFVIISRSPTASSYPAFYIGTEEPTDVMSSAVYTRNTNTEEKYGVKIEQVVSDSISNARVILFMPQSFLLAYA